MPLMSESGSFGIPSYDGRLILGTWEALRIEEHSVDVRWPYSIEFLPSEGVRVEVVEGEPNRFHAKALGTVRVPFRVTHGGGVLEDAFTFRVEEPKSLSMGACAQVLGGFGASVRFSLNDRVHGQHPQGLLPVEVVPSLAANVKAIDGYLATEFQLLVVQGFIGELELRSTLGDASSITLTAVDPRELELPRLFARGSVGLGKIFTVAAEGWTSGGVVCSRIPITLTATTGSACRVVRLLPDSLYQPFGRPMYEVVGEAVGGVCELVAQYDQATLEATLGVAWYAALPAATTAPVTVQLDIEILENPPPGATVDNGGGGDGTSDGWD